MPYDNAAHRALVPLTLTVHGRFPEDADLDTAWKRGLRAFHPAGTP
ncbi:hypothetical protein [Streptomyces collinus]|nr:hypothetical protein [Streptomyces collinus]